VQFTFTPISVHVSHKGVFVHNSLNEFLCRIITVQKPGDDVLYSDNGNASEPRANSFLQGDVHLAFYISNSKVTIKVV